MCEQGIPINFEQHKGYFVVQKYFLPPVSFTNEEANALLLMEAIVSGNRIRTIIELDTPQWSYYIVCHRKQKLYECHFANYPSQRAIGGFLRLLNVPIPGSYGPSADEQWN